MKLKYSFLLFSYSMSTVANDLLINCHAKFEITNAIEKLNVPDCGLAKGLVKNAEVQEFHRNFIYEKLAEKLSTQIEQSLEENTLLGQFYNSNVDLLQDPEVKQFCRLDNITKSENCNGVINSKNPSYNIKLGLLKSKIRTNLKKTCGKKELSLQELLKSKVTQTLGVKLPPGEKCSDDQNTCPAQGSSGAFAISAQLDDKTSKDLILQIQSNKPNNELIDQFFNSYPQLKLIQSTQDNFKNEFIDYLKKHKNENPQAYINKFFFNNNNNHKKLSHTLAEQCKNLNKSIETFLCKDELVGDQLASLKKDTSLDLFGLNPELKDDALFEYVPDIKENFYAAFGFQCLAKNSETKLSKSASDNSVDNWYSQFTQNTRPQVMPVSQVNEINSEFCSLYECKNPEVKNTIYCKNNGPITSEALKTIFKCNSQTPCSSDMLKYISYIENLAPQGINLKVNLSSQMASNISTNNEAKENVPQYSSFMQNYLGVSGTLLAEGKEITAQNVAEKTKEFTEKKLDPTPPTQESKILDVKTNQMAKSESSSQAPESRSNPTQQPSFDPQFDNIASESTKKPHSIATGSTPSNNHFGAAESTNNDAEIKKMRSELESLTSSLKGSQAEKLATITDSNSVFSPSSLGGATSSDLSKSLNSAERARNDEYQKNLASWENRLRNWQSDLTDRELRVPNRAVATNNNNNNKNVETNESSNPSKISRNEAQPFLTAATDNNDKSAEKSSGKLNKNTVSLNGESLGSSETILSESDLANLKIENLNKLGINSKSSFVIKILHQKKYYNVSVKIFPYKNKDILVPLLNESNSTIAKIVLESPLFREYKQLQLDRQKERQASLSDNKIVK